MPNLVGIAIYAAISEAELISQHSIFRIEPKTLPRKILSESEPHESSMQNQIEIQNHHVQKTKYIALNSTTH